MGVTRRRCAGDRGSSAVEFAILFPVVALLLFGGPQLTMWYFAREAAEAAATSAAREASTLAATPESGRAAAAEYLERIGTDTITGYQVDVKQSEATVTVRIHATVQKIVPLPGISPTADVTVTRPRERFTTGGSP